MEKKKEPSIVIVLTAYLLSRLFQGMINLHLPDALLNSVVLSGDLSGPSPRLFAQRCRRRIVFGRDAVHGIAVARIELVVDVLLQHGIVEVAALEVVVSGELFGLVADCAEGVLHGRAGE